MFTSEDEESDDKFNVEQLTEDEAFIQVLYKKVHTQSRLLQD